MKTLIISLLSFIALGLSAVSPLTAAPKHQTAVSEAVMAKIKKQSAKLTATQKRSLLKTLNSGSPKELQSLPGVGAEKAGYIKKSRPFKSVDELANVTGVGEQTFANIVAHTKKPGSVAKKVAKKKVSTASKVKKIDPKKKTASKVKKEAKKAPVKKATTSKKKSAPKKKATKSTTKKATKSTTKKEPAKKTPAKKK